MVEGSYYEQRDSSRGGRVSNGTGVYELIDAATAPHCDLIMASHGGRRMSPLLPGSETSARAYPQQNPGAGVPLSAPVVSGRSRRVMSQRRLAGGPDDSAQAQPPMAAPVLEPRSSCSTGAPQPWRSLREAWTGSVLAGSGPSRLAVCSRRAHALCRRRSPCLRKF